MAKSNLYTRSGDAGTTSLAGGQRVPKQSVRLEAYGTVDEFSATLALVLSDKECPQEIRLYLRKIQNKLFNAGAYLATDSPQESPATLYGITDDDISELEQKIDALDAAVPPLRAFVLPGGSPASSKAQLARTVCRRAERRIYALNDLQKVSPILLQYFNRLSDYLFILARYLNHISGQEELIWQK